MITIYEQWGLERGIAQGIEQGVLRGKRDAVLLRLRFGDLPGGVTERIKATATGDELDRLLDQTAIATSLSATGLLNNDEDDAPATTNHGNNETT